MLKLINEKMASVQTFRFFSLDPADVRPPVWLQIVASSVWLVTNIAWVRFLSCVRPMVNLLSVTKEQFNAQIVWVVWHLPARTEVVHNDDLNYSAQIYLPSLIFLWSCRIIKAQQLSNVCIVNITISYLWWLL